MAGAIAVWAAVFSCYALAFRAQSPLLSLVPPLALVVFADSVLDDVTKPVYGVLFLVAALAVLFADSLRRIRAWGPVWSPVAGQDRLLPVAGSNARRVGATALMVAALAPLFVPGFGTTSVLDISRFGSDNRIRVSPLVQMGSILRDTEDHNPPFFEVQVSSNQLSYWQMVALDTFDGNTWEAQADDGNQVTNGSIQLASHRRRHGPADLHDVGRPRLQLARRRRRPDLDRDRPRCLVAPALVVPDDGRVARRGRDLSGHLGLREPDGGGPRGPEPMGVGVPYTDLPADPDPRSSSKPR